MVGVEVLSSIPADAGVSISRQPIKSRRIGSGAKSTAKKFSLKRNLKLSKSKSKSSSPSSAEETKKITKSSVTKSSDITKKQSSKQDKKKKKNAAKRLASKVLPSVPSSVNKRSSDKKGSSSKKKIIPKFISKVLHKSSLTKNCDESLVSDGSITAASSNCSSCPDVPLSMSKSNSFDSMDSQQALMPSQHLQHMPLLAQQVIEEEEEEHMLPKDPHMTPSTSFGNLSAMSEQDSYDAWNDDASMTTLPSVVSFNSTHSHHPARLIISATPDDMSSTSTTDSQFTDDDDSTMASSVDTNNLVQKIEDLATQANQNEYRLHQTHHNTAKQIVVQSRDPPTPITEPSHAAPSTNHQHKQDKPHTHSAITATYFLFLCMSLLSKVTFKSIKLILDLVVTIASKETITTRKRRRRKWKHYQDKHQVLFFVIPLLLAVEGLSVLASQSLLTLSENHFFALLASNPASSHVALGITGCIKSLLCLWMMIQGQRHWSMSAHNDDAAAATEDESTKKMSLSSSFKSAVSQIQQEQQPQHVRRVHFAPSSNTTTTTL